MAEENPLSGLEFDDLRWIHLLWAVLLAAAAGVYGVWQRGRALRIFASAGLLPRIAPPLAWGRALLRLSLVVMVLLTLTAAIIHPRWGEREERIVRRGIDVMVLLDVSRSMLARDLSPNRLERAHIAIVDDLLPQLGGDRIGLIAFAGVASPKCPLTNDYGFFRLVMEDISPASVPVGGTMIGDAVRKAADAFDDTLETQKVILLITDGEDHESYPVEAARGLWDDRRIPIIAVGLGDDRQGARIPLPAAAGEQYLTYKDETVWSRADFEQLRQIAAASPLNAFIPVGTRDFDLGEIYRERIVPFLENQRLEETERVARPARQHLFAAVALALLLLESLLREGRRPAAAMAPALTGRQREAA